MIRLGEILHGRYRVVEALGSGGFGAVYKAEDLRLANRPVAIKHYATGHLSEQDAQEMATMFLSEAHTLARLSHPNLAQVLDYFNEGSDWLLIMEFVPGEPLSSVLRRVGGPLGEEQVIDWAIELCRVLEYLHRQDPPLIFRDLKPSNIMLMPEGRVILIDFGIARSFKEGKAQDTVQIGTPGYAPPEQYGGQTEPRSDLYSLGATMWALLTAQSPTSRGFNIPHLREVAPQVSPDLAALVASATSLLVQDRPASAVELRRALEKIQKRQRPAYVAPMAQQPPWQPEEALRASQGAPAAGRREPVRQQAIPRRPFPAPPAQSGVQWGPIAALLLVLLIMGGGAWYVLPPMMATTPSAEPSPEPTLQPQAVVSPNPVKTSAPSLIISAGSPGTNRVTNRDLVRLSSAGGAAAQLVVNPAFDYLASTGPDGRIIFTRALSESEEHIYVASTDGSNVRALTSGTNTINRAGTWSPDGKLVAFESNRDSRERSERDLYVMDADGGNVRRVLETPRWQGGPAWAPDGQRIAFHSDSTGEYQIFVLDLKQNRTRLLTGVKGEQAFWPSWSPDGQTIAFMTQRGDDTTAKIYLVPATGGTATQLDVGPGLNRWPRWSPDGRFLAFESNRDGPWQVYLYEVKTQKVTRISNGDTDDRWPGW